MEPPKKGNRRRDFLKAGAIVGAGIAAAAGYAIYSGGVLPSGPSSSTSVSTNAEVSSILSGDAPQEYKDFIRWLQSVSSKYKGTRLNINLQSEPDYRALQNLDVDFFSATGILSQYDLEPYGINYNKTALAVSTHSSTIDIIDFDSLDASTFNQYMLAPQTLADTYPDLTYPGFDMKDFLSMPLGLVATYPPQIPNLATPKGEVFCFPFNGPVMLLYYRTDVYSARGLTPPSDSTTWDDYYASVTDIGTHTNIYGADGQCQVTTPIFHEFTNHLYSFGGSFWDISGDTITPTLDSPKNVQALENFARLFPYTCPNALTNDWESCVNDMCRGYAANAITFEDDSAYVSNPLYSIETDTMDYSVNPSGPNGSYSTFIGDGLGISKFTKNPEAAWLWLQWATAQGTQMMLVKDQNTRYVPTRASVANSSFVRSITQQPSHIQVQLNNDIVSSGKVAFVPSFATSSSADHVIATQLFNAFIGQTTAQEALANAQAQLESATYHF